MPLLVSLRCAVVLLVLDARRIRVQHEPLHRDHQSSSAGFPSLELPPSGLVVLPDTIGRCVDNTVEDNREGINTPSCLCEVSMGLHLGSGNPRWVTFRQLPPP